MKKSFLKKSGIIIIILLVLLQFIQPARNNGEANGPEDITHVVDVPPAIASILDQSCNDCHSNHTEYPWYSRVQPIGLWLDHHVDEGRDELNFSTFAGYSHKRQLHKLDEIVEMVELHEMPLSSYTMMHSGAVLSVQQQADLIAWAKKSKASIGEPQSE